MHTITITIEIYRAHWRDSKFNRATESYRPTTTPGIMQGSSAAKPHLFTRRWENLFQAGLPKKPVLNHDNYH